MAANDLMKYGMIAVGGYIAWKYVLPSFGIGVPQVAQPDVVSTPQANNPVATPNPTKQLVINMAKASGIDPNSYLSVDGWNYLYTKVRGISGPAPEDMFPGVDRNKTYSIDEWWTGMTGAGFSGMGAIAHYVNPYRNPQGVGFGIGMQPTGMEMYTKRFGG